MVYIIAEIGVNFYDISKKYNISPIDACKLFIVEAKKSGASAVKFQSYKAKTLAAKESPSYWNLNEESCENQYDLFKKHDNFNESDFEFLSNYCKQVQIDFISTPFDLESADYLEKYQDIYKISSSDITNYPLLKKIGSKKKKTLLSTGASNIEEIKNAVNILEKNGCPNVVIMHCVLNYPTDNKNAHLNMLKDIKKHFPGYELGYSDHTRPDEKMLILTTSVLLGATYIEKHFTLDKTLKGNDHYHSMDPHDLKKFVENLIIIDDIMGKDIKEPLECEKISRLNARRSIVANANIKKGEVLNENNIICKRPATGISATEFFNILGKTVTKDIKDDTILKLEDIN